LIAELEPADAQAQLSQVRADVVAAEAKVERARADVTDADTHLAREQALLAKGAGTQATFDDAQAKLKIARAALAAAHADARATAARLSAAQVQLENTRIRAPFAGTILRKLAEIGEVNPPNGGPGVFLLAALNDLEVQADVSESQYNKVRV